MRLSIKTIINRSFKKKNSFSAPDKQDDDSGDTLDESCGPRRGFYEDPEIRQGMEKLRREMRGFTDEQIILEINKRKMPIRELMIRSSLSQTGNY